MSSTTADRRVASVESPLSRRFPRYTDYQPRAAVYCVTPELPGAIHRFYDTSPFSPSGRFLAVTRLPFENRAPRPGEVAEVVVIDLETGRTTTVAETRGWDVQLGAQVQWGADDRSLYFNDVDVHTWKPFGVRADPTTGGRHRLDGTVYMISPDGEWSASPCLLRMAATQAGYGVVVPRGRVPRNRGASEEDGIFLTSTSTGRSRLLASIGQILRQADPPLCPDEYRNGDFYGFHVKWNPQGTRLLFVLRWLPRRPLPIWPWKPRRHDGLKNVITMDADGKNIRVAISAARWSQGGHHPNWCPDGEHVLMNLNPGGGELRFVRARYDGSTLDVLAPDVCGSGHPTMHPDGQHILTDAYPKEPVAFGDGTVPLRWIDLRTSDEKALVRIRTRPEGRQGGGVLRVDPHPAWDASYRRIAFNACPGGRRQVFVADIHE